MIQKQVDVVIIGAGTAGMGAYRAAKVHTDSVVLIEGGAYGTTCARVGCMPSKLLIAAADAAHHATHADLFGVTVPQVKVDGKAVMKRVQAERDRFVGFVLDSVEGFETKDKLAGYARFKDDHTLVVDDKIEIKAGRIVIATGSRPIFPDILTGAGDRLLTNDSIFELETLPESLCVFGPGVIGLELGQAMSRLGVRVKVLGRSGSLGTLQDPEIRDYANTILSHEFYLESKSKVLSVEKKGAGVAVIYLDNQGQKFTETFSYILAATGRRPNIDSLGLENTTISLDPKGVPTFDSVTCQSSLDHVFIAGDVTNTLTILHEASDEGRIAGDNAGRYPTIQKGLRRAPFSVVFTDPQIAKVGLTLQECQVAHSDDVVIGFVSFEGQGRSRVMGKNKGILKVYGHKRSGLFLGAEMFGPSAEHIGHLLSWTIQQGLTVSEILEMPFYHPVIEEGVRTAFRDLNSKMVTAC